MLKPPLYSQDSDRHTRLDFSFRETCPPQRSSPDLLSISQKSASFGSRNKLGKLFLVFVLFV